MSDLLSVSKRRLGRVPGAHVMWSAVRQIWNRFEYRRDFARFSALAAAASRQVPHWHDRFPCLGQKTSSTEFDRHYVYHTSWAARILEQSRPRRHIDISSSLQFVGIISAFLEVEHYDYRPPDLCLDRLTTGFADLLNLPFADGSVSSLSCMHVVEHVGLGRYGDPLDAEGDTKAMRELMRVLAPGGQLLFVAPLGFPRVCFNAHRIYGYDQIRSAFANLELAQFRLVPDDPADGLIEASPGLANAQAYACGCFLFHKPI
jgi:SAM-dependent methyltransferase